MATIKQLSSISSLSAGDALAAWYIDNGDSRKASMTVVTAYVSAHLASAATDTLTASSYLKVTSCTVANLPSASTAGAGARATVTDATQTLTAGIGATVVGGAANIVPVFSDGTNWKIG